MSEEIELKLTIAPEALAAVLKSAVFASRAIRFKPARQLVTAYYDTPKGTLRKDGIFLRVRQSGRQFTQAVKTAGTEALLAQRGEWEWRLPSAEPDLDLAASTGLKPLVKRARKGDVVRLFASELARRTADVTLDDTVLELALDHGVVRAGRRTAPLCELEIEVKAGPVAPLFDLARAIGALPGVSVGFATKAARGFALAAGEKATAVKAGDPALDPGMSVSAAAVAILQSCAAHAAANLPAVVTHHLPEGIHQLRVALRRFRAALAVFKDVLPPEQRKALRKQAGRLAGALGPARELDVISAGLMTTPAPAALAADMDALRRRLAQARREAWRMAVDAVAAPETTLMLIDLAEAAWDLDHAPAAFDTPSLLAFATEQLEQRFAEVTAVGADLETLGIEARHKVRLALKKLRYAADFFVELFPRKSAKTGMKVLVALQEALGGFNDAASVEAILERVVAASPAKTQAQLGRAALFLSGWAAHGGANTWNEARACWAAFTEKGAFWR